MAAGALALAAMLAGCDTDSVEISAKALKPLSPQMLAELERKHMPKESPTLVRLFKEEAELEIWKQDDTGRYGLLATYPICRWSGELGPKIKQGDRQAPEGFYTITPAQLNPNSHYYLSFDIGYPNAFDRALGRTGSNLMVHGDCSSAGCYAMTDEQIGEIYALARESFFGGQRSFQVQAYPFRMNPAFQAKYRTSLVRLADGKVHTLVEERATGSVSASAEASQSGSQSTGNFFTRLFGGGSSEEEKPQPAVAQTTAPASKSAPVRTASASKPTAKSEPKQEAHAKPHGPKPQAPAQSPAQQTAQAAPQPAASAEATKLP